MSLLEALTAPEAALGWAGVVLAPRVGQGDLGWEIFIDIPSLPPGIFRWVG